jgi:hypothetical protein
MRIVPNFGNPPQSIPLAPYRRMELIAQIIVQKPLLIAGWMTRH